MRDGLIRKREKYRYIETSSFPTSGVENRRASSKSVYIRSDCVVGREWRFAMDAKSHAAESSEALNLNVPAPIANAIKRAAANELSSKSKPGSI
jgi:hypothetical protein